MPDSHHHFLFLPPCPSLPAPASPLHVWQVPVIQLLLGQLGLVTADQMLGIWRYVVVGGVTAAAVLTPSTDPLTQCLLAGPLIGLYMGGAYLVKLLEGSKSTA
ncbi:unnamed protein product [Closterium sp. NIES-54]